MEKEHPERNFKSSLGDFSKDHLKWDEWLHFWNGGKSTKMVSISIDKLSFTARLDTANSGYTYEYQYNLREDGFYDVIETKKGQSYSTLSEYLNDVPYQCDYRHMSWNFIYQHQWHFKESGLFIQLGDFEGEKVFRMEFNPNKLEKGHLTFYYNILNRIKYPNVTRIDWAVDYPEDMSKYDFKQLTSRKTIEYKSRTGILETLYIGSPKSDKFTRVYNKALEKRKTKLKLIDEEEEIKVKETLWRVEAVVKNFELKVEREVEKWVEHPEGASTVKIPQFHWITGHDDTGRQISKRYELAPITKLVEGAVRVEKKEKVGVDYIFQNPFETLEIYKKYEGSTKGLKTAEKAMLFFLEHNPDAWDELSPNTRKKYEELTYTYQWMQIENQPKSVFEKEKYRLADELESWLKPALDKSYYLTGYKSNIYFSLLYLKEQREKEKNKRNKERF